MFLSINEICFFSLIFVITTTALIGFNQTVVKFKNVSPILSSYIVSFLITILLLSVYKLTNIQHKEKEGFHFELSKSKKCQGYPYMHSSNPELLKECAQELSTEEGRCNARCNGHNLNHFEYTPESNQYWENERCGQQKPNTLNNCRSGVNFIQYSSSPTGEKSSENFQQNFSDRENFNGPAESDLLKTEKPVCAFGPGFVQYECPDGIKFFDSGETSDSSGPDSSQYLGISGSSGPDSSQYLGISGSSGPDSSQYLGISGSSGPDSSQYLGISGSSGSDSSQYIGISDADSSTVGPFVVSQRDILSNEYNRSFYQPLRVKNKFNEKGTTYAYLANSTYKSRNNPERSVLY
jgi:hypothetical protein